MSKKKLSTEEILKAARAQAGGASGDESSQGDEGGAASAQASAPKPGGGAPNSTQDILAAARAQAGGGGAAKKSDSSAGAAGAPKSTSDILAAARAQAGGGAGAKPAAGSAPKSAKTGGAAKPVGDRPSVQDMLKAVREGKPAEAAAVAAKPKLPPRPQKPATSAKAGAAVAARRSVVLAIVLAPLGLFSSAFSTAWTLFTAATAAAGLAVARFMMPNTLVEPPNKFKIGPPSDYPPGVVSAKWKAKFAVWIVHTVYDGRNVIYALSTVCTHLGCTPNWLEGEQKYKCPCHGSGFYINGVNFEGPAPRPLERYGIRLAEDGMLEVDKGVKFQEEMGQWKDSNSYVEVS